MKPIRLIVGFSALAVLFAFYAPGQGEEGTEAKTATYLVASPHTPEECLAALDEFAKSGKNGLDDWYWGCMDGDHTGYEIIQASSKEEALDTVPENLRGKAKATELSQITAEQVAAMHKKK